MTCDKMIWEKSSNENTRTTNDMVMEMGRYTVRTTRRTDSAAVQDLISTLNGASNIQYKLNSFTAILRPKDLKKLCRNNHLVRTIKEVERMNKVPGCNKLRKGDPKFVVPSSYIVINKPHNDMSEMIPLNQIMIESNSLDSSVMITRVRQFRNPNRRGAAMRMNSDAVEFVCNQSVVDYIEEDQEVTLASSTSLWHLDRIDQRDLPLDGEYTTPNDGSGVDIYVFDTGINYDHEEFEGRAKFDSYDPLDSENESDQQGRDCNGHGTHVAALITGKTYGVAKGATVYSMRVFGCSDRGEVTTVLDGLSHVIDQQTKNRSRRIIINMSLSGPFSRAMDDYINDATEQGILVIGAAGNDFKDACENSPGGSPNVLTVGGSERRDDLYLTFFFATNYGRCVDIFAPGQDVLSAGIGSNDAVEIRSGTSQASPIVSGAAAIYWNMNKTATPLDIKNMIISSCTRDHLNINGIVPASFADQTPNCLLFIDTPANQETSTHVDMDNVTYHVFYSIPSSMVEALIKTQENSSYALTYIDSYSVNSVTRYTLIFKYMPDVEFITIMSSKLTQIRRFVASYEAEGYQLTVMHYKMNSVDHIVVLEKTNLTHSHEYKLTRENHNSLYQTKSSQGESLLSTTVAQTTGNGQLRYSSIYVHDSIETHHFSSVSVSEFTAALDEQLSQEFYLTNLATIPTDPPSYSVVFHKMTKPDTSYVMSRDLELDQVSEFVQTQVSEGFTPLVVAGYDTPNGLKFVVSFEQ